jgi:hypothetical protein
VEDISLHILDIAENAVRADATTITIIITKDTGHDLLCFEVIDDGRGMDAGTLARVRDPFFTTKGKKTGLGIPLLSQAAEQAGGRVNVDSTPGRGTKVAACFRWSHVDRPAIGSMSDTVLTLIAGHPDLDVVYEAREGDRVFRLDTREIKNDLEEVPINDPAVLDAIRGMFEEQGRFER